MIREFMIYSIVATALSVIDFHFACLSFHKGNKTGRALGVTAVCACVITMAYLLSITLDSMVMTSVMSSIVFIGIDFLLIYLIHFVILATKMRRNKVCKTILYVLRSYTIFDTIVLTANIFTGTAVGYELVQPVGIIYRMKPLYVMHLVFTYLQVVLIIGILIYKIFSTPRQYRTQYLLVIATIFVVVLLNAVFLFPETHSFFNRVDCSVFGYSLGVYLLFWITFTYRRKNMMQSLSMTIVEEINQGIVLFDYDDEMIMFNTCAEELLQGIQFEEQMTRKAFLTQCGLPDMPGDVYTLQYDREEGKPIRCEFRRLFEKSGRNTGSLFVFTNISRDVDNVTGFEYGTNLRKYSSKNQMDIVLPTVVAVFDIIGLKAINRTLGRDIGDARIRSLAATMRANLPEGTAFFRGEEAQLIAVRIHTSEKEFLPSVEKVVNSCESTVFFGISTAENTSAGIRDINPALETAYRDLQVKKLLNTGSLRSQALSSLVRALEETDEETEAHVRRTQKMGVALGSKIGLSDAELTELQLLCLLHDIGKIAVPLEILNKPGKLTDTERAVLQNHPEKGYQIALTTDELRPIAELILYHHERWDGKGYPKKLAGTQIPILSRIISVVDAYDAMVNDRCYRKALSPETAQEEIRSNAGTQFDPELATAFLELLEEQPDIAVGEVTDGKVESLLLPVEEYAETGNAEPIQYSKYMLNAEHIIIEVDEQFEQITGYKREEVIGKKTQFELIPEDDRAFYIQQVQNQLNKDNIAYLKHGLVRKDGTVIQVICMGERYFDSAVKSLRNEIIIFTV